MIVVLAETIVDEIHQQRSLPNVAMGGSGGISAVALGRLGSSVRLATTLGQDKYGDMIRALMNSASVELSELGDELSRTSVATAILNEAGDASYTFSLDLGLRFSPEIDPNVVAIHTGSLAATVEPGATKIRQIFVDQRKRGTVTLTYDPNVRPALVEDLETERLRVEKWVELVDFVKASHEDIELLYPTIPYFEVAKRWLSLGPALVVVTRADQGAYALTAAGAVNRPALSVDVSDTIGAGDTMMAAMLHFLDQRQLLGPEFRAHFAETEEQLVGQFVGDMLDFGILAASISVSRPGADPPTLVELFASRSVP